ncbi:hypothetical protein ABT023_16380 [Micromonospora sp. NPDC002296]|uniref:hypothetical protein n=1 Tax=Micromonospora sp. NPDC002296 TaxID=3154271 RepID=UPI0033295371
MSQIDRIDGGVNTARVSAAEADRIYREQRQADALRFLRKRGLDDVAEILGLVEPATPAPQVRDRIGSGKTRRGAA